MPTAKMDVQDKLIASEQLDEQLDRAARALRAARQLLVFSGAGMSAECGIGTFRGKGGMWSGLFGKVLMLYGATPLGWRLTPGLAWKYFVQLFYSPIAAATPHDGYRALVRLQDERFGSRMSVVTMNVDGLHQAAGSARVHEVHGSVVRFRCGSCAEPMEIDEPLLHARNWWDAPRCAACGRGRARPDCTLFGEALPRAAWEAALTDIESLESGAVLLVVGTSSVVYPAANIPAHAKRRGATVIEINPEDTALTELADLTIRTGASAALCGLADRVLAGADGAAVR
jgi:NAD-dependent deacetylase